MANGGGFKEEHTVLSLKESCSGHRYSSVASVLCSYGGGIVEGISDYGAELILYQATIIKYVRDFHGPASAQYDRAYRSQVPQTKDTKVFHKWLPGHTVLKLLFRGHSTNMDEVVRHVREVKY